MAWIICIIQEGSSCLYPYYSTDFNILSVKVEGISEDILILTANREKERIWSGVVAGVSLSY